MAAQWRRTEGDGTVDIMHDISKAFDRVRYAKLAQEGEAVGYPTKLLQMALLSYMWDRRLSDGIIVADAVRTTRAAICAGSETYELRALTLGALDRVTSEHPQATLVVHVDDISASVTARGTMAVVRELKDVDDCIVREIEKLKLPFAHGKAAVVATSRELALLATRHVGPQARGASARPDVTTLGYDYSRGRRGGGK